MRRSYGGAIMQIDTTFDFRTESGSRDQDRYSPTLKKYHQLLWSKPMPNGDLLELRPEPGRYLKSSSLDEIHHLSSDTISNSYRSQKKLSQLISQISDAELDSFQAMGATIGGCMLFPGNRVKGTLTINVARGFAREINDRIDLTLECIRLQYLGNTNPLERTFAAYWSFFQLFQSFEGFVDFFLLQDLVQRNQVKFFLPFEQGFSRSPSPQTTTEYRAYKNATMSFVAGRNERINQWVAAH